MPKAAWEFQVAKLKLEKDVKGDESVKAVSEKVEENHEGGLERGSELDEEEDEEDEEVEDAEEVVDEVEGERGSEGGDIREGGDGAPPANSGGAAHP